MYVNKNDLTQIVQEAQAFTDRTDVDAIQYPKGYPSSTIPELALVTECDCPTDCVALGYHVELDGEDYTQVWESRAYTEEELAQQAIDQASQIQARQKQLIEGYGWKISRYERELPLIPNIRVTTTDTEAYKDQLCEWCNGVGSVDETALTYELKLAALDLLETLQPYATQAQYDADALNLRGE